MDWDPTVLDLAGLRVEARPRPSHFDRWFDCHIAVTAHPFAARTAQNLRTLATIHPWPAP